MRLKRYLKEDGNIDSIIDNLKKDCKPFLDQVKNSFFYRGYKGDFVKDIKKVKSRIDRRPSDTIIDVHNTLDDLFKKKFGWKARSEGVFATGSEYQACQYGISYLFFPIAKFNFIWSLDIIDLYIKISKDNFNGAYSVTRGEYKYDKDKKEFITFEEWKQEKFEEHNKKQEEFFNKLAKLYSKTNLNKAMKSGHEVMFKCKEYYLVNTSLKKYLLKELWK